MNYCFNLATASTEVVVVVVLTMINEMNSLITDHNRLLRGMFRIVLQVRHDMIVVDLNRIDDFLCLQRMMSEDVAGGSSF